MTSYFLDSCAIAKRYIAERGSTYMQELCAATAARDEDLYISQVALVEVGRVICTMARESSRHRQRRFAARDGLIARFETHCDPSNGDYDVIELMPEVTERAGKLCKSHGITSLDAIQLASALIVRDFARSGGDPAPVFVTADSDLLRYARAEGFTVRNPVDHTHPDEANLPLRRSESRPPGIFPLLHDLPQQLRRLLLRR